MSLSISSPDKSDKNKKPPGCVGVGVCLMSLVFVVVGVWAAFSAIRTSTWQEVPCRFEKIKITQNKNEDNPFKLEVDYLYTWEGERYHSVQLETDSESRETSFEKLFELKKELTTRGTCYINKKNPSEAILKRSFISALLFGIAFSLFGSLFFFFGITTFQNRSGQTQAISSSAKNKNSLKGNALAYIFFSIFALAGTAMFIGLILPKATRYLSSKSWVETEAQVIWSQVRSSSSDDGTTYRPDIFYRYRYEGANYRSNGYSIVGGSSSGIEAKRKIVLAHPPKHRFTCYINPDKPWQALITRDLGWSALFALFPLPFMAVGFGGLWWLIFRSPHQKSNSGIPKRSYQRSHLSRKKQSNKPTQTSRGWGKLIGVTFAALFWCGIVSVFVTIAVKSWLRGDPEWFLTIFIIPFVLIGLGLLGAIPYHIIALFSPRFTYEFEEKDLHPGSATQFKWRQTGGSGEITSFNLTLEGREEATYQRGTNTVTATSIFYKKEIFVSTRNAEFKGNECELIIPSDTIPTFEGENNKITWSLNLTADVKRRPNVKEGIALTILPLTETDFQ